MPYRQSISIYCLSINIFRFAIVSFDHLPIFFQARVAAKLALKGLAYWGKTTIATMEGKAMSIFSFRNLTLASLVVFSTHAISVAQSISREPRGCDQALEHHSAQSQVCVENGYRRPVIDTAGWVLGIPAKILLWDRRAINHAVSDPTVGEITNYLVHNNLTDTVVRVNQYAPGKEWRRLVSNRRISPGWRYTVGSLKWLKYTLIPGRLFGTDEYNPYTNSLYIYSDMPTLGLAEAAYAKDVSRRRRPGTYAAVQDLPLVALWHETLATDEVLNYVSIHGSSEHVQKVRHDLYARFGIETAGVASQILPDGTGLFLIVGAVSGHAIAALEGRQLPTQLQASTSSITNMK